MKIKQVSSIFFAICLFLFLSIQGCLENKNDDHSDSYDYFVDLSYNKNTNGWNIDHFKSINDAINKSVNHTSIFVYSGIYTESIIIDKTIKLNGENVYTTIINGTQHDDIIYIKGNGQITLSNFTITNSSIENNQLHSQAGIDLRSSGNSIMYNIFKGNSCGVYSRYADNNKIFKNKFINNDEYGVYLDAGSDENLVFENLFINNSYASRIIGSKYCDIYYNIFVKNIRGLYFCCGAKYNVIYANIFCNNSRWNANDSYENNWHNEIPLHWNSYLDTKTDEYSPVKEPMGNYWDTFHLNSQGAYDNNSDGIIDSSYKILDIGNYDEYPLVKPPLISNPFIETEEIIIECK